MRNAHNRWVYLLLEKAQRRVLSAFHIPNHIHLSPWQTTLFHFPVLANQNNSILYQRVISSQPSRSSGILKLYERNSNKLLEFISYPNSAQRITWLGRHGYSRCQTLSRTLTRGSSELLLKSRLPAVPSWDDNPTNEHLQGSMGKVIHPDHLADADSSLTKQQLNDFFKQRLIEIELLKRTLTGALERLITTKIKLYQSDLKAKAGSSKKTLFEIKLMPNSKRAVRVFARRRL